VLDDRRKLAALTSATRLMEKILMEREPQSVVFGFAETFVHALVEGTDWLAAYVKLEFAMLEHAGFGLDLARCAATGQSHDLTYVSPKSGRAVSLHAGKPYHERLFALPAFLISHSPPGGKSQSVSDAVGGNNHASYTPLPNPPPQGGRVVNGTHPQGERGYEEINIVQILDGVRLCGYFLHERIFAPRGTMIPGARKRFVEMLHIKEPVLG
jgi:hypothetical protein